MKKLSKVVLAASMFAALFAGCSNGLVANDTLDAPDVDIFATESGVIVLEWDAVKDADDGYEVYVKTPYSEKYVATSANINLVGGIYRYVYADVSEADSEYSFKVVAKTSKVNLLSSETEVSVDTPEAFKETTIDASKIAFTLKPRSVNKYDISIPVDYGYDYSLRLTKYTDDAKVIFAGDAVSTGAIQNPSDWNSNTNAWNTRTINVSGAAFVLETKENADGDDVAVAPVVGDMVVPDTNGENYYIAVRATPKNTKLSTLTKQYAISTASVAFDHGGITWPWRTPTLTTEEVTNTATSVTTKVTIKFQTDKINGNTAVDASKYQIYCVKTTASEDTAKFVSTLSQSIYSKAVEADTDANASATTGSLNNYKFIETVTESEAAGTVLTGYRFDYYIVFENEDGDAFWVDAGSYNPNSIN